MNKPTGVKKKGSLRSARTKMVKEIKRLQRKLFLFDKIQHLVKKLDRLK